MYADREIDELIYLCTCTDKGNFTTATKDFYAMDTIQFYRLVIQRNKHIKQQIERQKNG